MIQDISPYTYHNEFMPVPIDEKACILSYDKRASSCGRKEISSHCRLPLIFPDGRPIILSGFLPLTIYHFSWPGAHCQLLKASRMCLSDICAMPVRGTWHLLVLPVCHWPGGTAIISYAAAAAGHCSTAKRTDAILSILRHHELSPYQSGSHRGCPER